ncbi:MAG: prepilin-type N-terminal cleavage/methylation domain-containing protein [Calditrichaeota bacterium]|nr:prepilin-type N-terminal cleavage/methylation domain-containing protein [Calditrichota bacterium]
MKRWHLDDGFTIIEIIIVLVITGIFAAMFSETIVSTMTIYSDSNLRKNAHIDLKRTFEQFASDVRSWQSWQSAISNTVADLNRVGTARHQNGTIYYINNLRLAYSLASGALRFQRSDVGNWSNLYMLIPAGITMNSSRFTETVAGGKRRVTIEVVMTTNNKPFRARTTIFPRKG